jgi:hypothetical protein
VLSQTSKYLVILCFWIFGFEYISLDLRDPLVSMNQLDVLFYLRITGKSLFTQTEMTIVFKTTSSSNKNETYLLAAIVEGAVTGMDVDDIKRYDGRSNDAGFHQNIRVFIQTPK